MRSPEQQQALEAAVHFYESHPVEKRKGAILLYLTKKFNLIDQGDIDAGIASVESFITERDAQQAQTAGPAREIWPEQVPMSADALSEAITPSDNTSREASAGDEAHEHTPYAQNPVVNGLVWPDVNGEFPTPLDGALWMASLGVPQTPLRPKTKDAFLPNFPALTTTDPTILHKWAVDYSGCNFGSVSKEGNTLVFEADSP